MEGRPAQFLLDTGCTTNLLAKHVFDRLPESIRSQTQECARYGLLADGTRLPFYGIVKLNIRLRQVKTEEVFIISQINEDAILGMPFLVDRHCSMDFRKPIIQLDGHELKCTDRQGRLLSNHIQTVKGGTLPPESERTMLCRVTSRNYCPMGIVEALPDGVLLAASLSRPDDKGRLLVRCLNPTKQPVELRCGTVVGTYTGVEEDEVDDQPSLEAPACSTTQAEVPGHVQDLFESARHNCETEEQERQLAELLRKYSTVFSTGDEDVGLTDLVEHSIPVAPGTRPIRQPPHRLGPEKEAEAERQVQELLKKGLIEPAGGAWSSPVVLVRKKDKSWRFCVDYRRLNTVTQQDAYPLPRIDESLEALAGSKFFTTLDLLSGYWQVPLDADAQEKSAFITRSGLWKWRVLPFGLTSAPATFQRLMEQVLRGLHWKTALLYLDDVIVISPDFPSHLLRLEEVLQRLQKAGLKLKPQKCELLQEEVRYLGHIVSADGIATDPEKIAAIKNWPTPQNLKQLQAFLGTAGYYRQYLPEFATVAKPLHQLTSKGAEWIWDSEAQAAFEELRQRLTAAPILGYPDPRLEYILDTDASDVGVGAVLSQIQQGQERVIAYFSKTLSPAERNYCVTRRELLAVVKAVKHFRPYLYGQRFKLRTDHASLMWLCRRQEPAHQIARWLELLSEFQYSTEHRKGTKHGNADGLSRRACIDCKQCKRVEERDGGPSHAQIAEEMETGVAWQRARTPDKQCPVAAPNELADIARVEPSTTPVELKKLQNERQSPVAMMYRALASGEPLTEEQLSLGSRELRQLNQRRHAMKIDEQDLLAIRVCIQEKARWCTLCPVPLRKTVIWQAHNMAHSGINRTLGRIQLAWYWPGMTAEVRRVVKSCEVCQAAKGGGTHPAGGQQRLFAGRPWQKVAVDLVGPMPLTSRGNKWILVLMDHFTRWQDAIALPDATAPVVATALDEKIFCYMGLPEQIHTDQGAQFESSLMAELCQLWGVEKTRTTPYHPQANGMVERNNRLLGDSLRAMLIGRGQDEWDLLLPQIMRAFRGTPHSTTGETPNLMMLGRELRLPDQLQYLPPPGGQSTRHQYVQDVHDRLEEAHSLLQEQQLRIRQEDDEEPPLFMTGDLVWLENKRRRKGENPKLQPKFVGPYEVIEAWGGHTYRIERQGQQSIQHESRLKPFRACAEPSGQAPATLEPARRPNMKGAAPRRKTREVEPTLEPTLMFEPESAERAPVQSSMEEATPTQPEDSVVEANPSRMTTEIAAPPIENHGRPRRTRQPPQWYGEVYCHEIDQEEKAGEEKSTEANHRTLRQGESDKHLIRKGDNSPTRIRDC